MKSTDGYCSCQQEQQPKPRISGFYCRAPSIWVANLPVFQRQAISRISTMTVSWRLGKQFYGNAKDFTFYFVGNYDEKTLLPLIEQYIASLPNNGFKLKNKQIPYAKGEVKQHLYQGNGEPSEPRQQRSGMPSSHSPCSTMVLADVTSARLLEMKYLRTIREELSAAYHAGATFGLLRDLTTRHPSSITAMARLEPGEVGYRYPYFFKGMEETREAGRCSRPCRK